MVRSCYIVLLTFMYSLTLCVVSSVFMDLMMPKMGGDETISRFRQWESINRVGQRRQAICILSGSENFKHKYKQMGTLQCAVLFPIEFSHAMYINPLARTFRRRFYADKTVRGAQDESRH